MGEVLTCEKHAFVMLKVQYVILTVSRHVIGTAFQIQTYFSCLLLLSLDTHAGCQIEDTQQERLWHVNCKLMLIYPHLVAYTFGQLHWYSLV